MTRFRLQDVTACPQISITGGSSITVVGVADAARGVVVQKAAVGGGAGSAQVRALALETLDASGLRR
jgi:hypothetical protein